MQAYIIIRYLFLIMSCFVLFQVQAEEITLQHKGLTLNAELSLVAEKKLSDGVILITHGALAHRDMESIRYMRKLLKDRGHNTLAINLSLGLNDRHGMYDCKTTHRHQNDDAVEEIGLWVGWLQKQGVKQITLLGHSRGGAQTALYAVTKDNSVIQKIVLLAPATADNTSAAAYKKRYDRTLASDLDRAKIMVNHRQGDTILEHVGLLTCRDTTVTANSFVSYYGQDRNLDAPYLLSKLQKPVFVVVAGNDEVVVGLDKKIEPLLNRKGIKMEVVDGADHLFRDLYADDAIDAVNDFLSEN